jgi:transcriptional regulator with XRE-family HTH domain
MGRIQEALKRIAEQRQLSAAEIGRAIGMSRSGVSGLLSGDKTLTENRILQFCDVLGVTLADLEEFRDEEMISKLRYILKHSRRSESAIRGAIDHAFDELRQSKQKRRP